MPLSHELHLAAFELVTKIRQTASSDVIYFWEGLVLQGSLFPISDYRCNSRVDRPLVPLQHICNSIFWLTSFNMLVITYIL